MSGRYTYEGAGQKIAVETEGDCEKVLEEVFDACRYKTRLRVSDEDVMAFVEKYVSMFDGEVAVSKAGFRKQRGRGYVFVKGKTKTVDDAVEFSELVDGYVKSLRDKSWQTTGNGWCVMFVIIVPVEQVAEVLYNMPEKKRERLVDKEVGEG